MLVPNSNAPDNTGSPTGTSKPSLAPPDDLIPKPNSPYFMSKGEWHDVQCYIEAGISMPTSSQDAVIKLGINPSDGDHFSDLWSAYQRVQEHCSDFKTNIFPKTVNLAAKISNYGANMVPVFYKGLMDVLTSIDDGKITNDEGQKKVGRILDKLLSTAQIEAKRANDVAASIDGFIVQTQKDQAFLGPILNKYRTEYEGYDGASGLLAQYRQQVNDANAEIARWNDEYRHDVTVASTTVTYAWITPLGTIAAAIVAGIYGQKARDALKEIDSWKDTLASVETKLASALLLDADLNLVNRSMEGLVAKLQAALPILQKIEGIWHAMAADIGNIIDTINNDIKGAPTFIAELGVDVAIGQWKAVADAADQYRVNAYVVFVDRKTIEDNPEKYQIKTAA